MPPRLDLARMKRSFTNLARDGTCSSRLPTVTGRPCKTKKPREAPLRMQKKRPSISRSSSSLQSSFCGAQRIGRLGNIDLDVDLHPFSFVFLWSTCQICVSVVLRGRLACKTIYLWCVGVMPCGMISSLSSFVQTPPCAVVCVLCGRDDGAVL